MEEGDVKERFRPGEQTVEAVEIGNGLRDGSNVVKVNIAAGCRCLLGEGGRVEDEEGFEVEGDDEEAVVEDIEDVEACLRHTTSQSIFMTRLDMCYIRLDRILSDQIRLDTALLHLEEAFSHRQRAESAHTSWSSPGSSQGPESRSCGGQAGWTRRR